MINRRAFIGTAAGAWLTGVLPTLAITKPSDWKAAFAKLGFDPSAKGCGMFIVTADTHFHYKDTARSFNFEAVVKDWNAMSPKPEAVFLLGDCTTLNSCFGHTPPPSDLPNQIKSMELLKAELDKIDPAIKVKLVIGNHDSHPGEVDCPTFRKVFPDVKPYEKFSLLGIDFYKWNGGQGGMFDPGQRAWIRANMKNLPDDKAVVVLVHQPGDIANERDPVTFAKEMFANRKGETWVLAGHAHCNSGFRKTLPGGGMIAWQVHTWNKAGYWIYGVKDGSIVARVYCNNIKGTVNAEKALSEMPVKGPLKTIFDDCSDMEWHCFVDEPEELKCRISSFKSMKPGGWFAYTDKLLYKFPKAELAPKAKRFVVIAGAMEKKIVRKGMDAPLCKYSFSLDGKEWEQVPTPKTKNSLMEIALPERFVSAKELWFKLDAFHFSSGNVGGFAFFA